MKRLMILAILCLWVSPVCAVPMTRVVLFGDSVFASQAVTDAMQSLEVYMEAQDGNLHVIPYATSGWAITPSTIQANISGVLPLGPAIIVTEFGLNDWYWVPNLVAFRTAYGEMLDTFLTAGKEVYCFLPTYHTAEGSPRGGTYLSQFRTIITEECTARGVPVLDARVVLPPTESWWRADGCHPNAQGYSVLGRWLADQIGHRQ